MLTFQPFLSLGVIFLTALAFSILLGRFKLPAVTSYLLLGIIIGPFLLNFVDQSLLDSSGMLSKLVLSLIAFSIGQNFSIERFKEIGRAVISISLVQSLAASIFTGAAVYLVTGDMFYTMAFAAIAPATAPAAVVMVVRECRARGKFTDTLLGIVAFDDIWGLIIFSLILAIIRGPGGLGEGLLDGVVEVSGAVSLGVLMGLIFSSTTRYTRHDSELLICTLGFIVLTAGLSLLCNFSVLLANMALSATFVNLSKPDYKVFKVIKEIDSPFYLLFFVIAGASLEINLLASLGLVGSIYMLARVFGKVAGTWLSSIALRFPWDYGFYLGIGLVPQAGVALGMAMIVNSVFPDKGSYVLTTVIATTVIYELFGPILTRVAIKKSGELP